MNWYLLMAWAMLVCATCSSVLSDRDNGAEDEDSVQIVDLPYGDTLKYDLGYFGDEEGAFVFKEPKNNVFHGFCSPDREPLIYCYLAQKDSQEPDTVIFKLGYDSPGYGPVRRIEERMIIINSIPDASKHDK